MSLYDNTNPVSGDLQGDSLKKINQIIASGGGGSSNSVLYTPQTKTEAEQAIARANLGVLGAVLSLPNGDTVVTSDTDTNNHPFLAFAVEAGKKYALNIVVFFMAGDGGLSVQFNTSVSTTQWDASIIQNSAGVFGAQPFIGSSLNEEALVTDPGATQGALEIKTVLVAATSGSINLGVAQNTSDPTNTTFRGTSYATIQDITA